MTVDDHVMDNPRAERVKRAAALAGRSGRRKQGLFLAEGPQPVREALALWLARWEPGEGQVGDSGGPGGSGKEVGYALPALDALYFDPAALEQHPDVAVLVDRLRGVLFDPQQQLPGEARVFLREATAEVLAAMGETETSQGIIAVCRTPTLKFEAVESLLTGLIRPGENAAEGEAPAALAPVLAGLQDPGNVGTIIRTADAAGAGAVILSPGSADPWAPKVVRAAAGSHFHLPIAVGVDLQQLSDFTRSSGWDMIAADGYAETSLAELDSAQLSRPALWLVGNEAHGLSGVEKALADHRVAIPLYGQAESLNVAVAASMCLYASAVAQRRSRR